MNTILMSIKPEWVAKILNGEKTIEVRKKFPKDYVGWVYIYCTKDLKSGKQALTWLNERSLEQVKNITYKGKEVLGKVVARFWCDKVKYLVEDKFHEYYTEELEENEILKKSCLTYSQLFNYLKGKVGYAIHISKLEVFDKPRELSDYVHYVKPKRTKYDIEFEKKMGCKTFYISKALPLKRPPQSWCYIEIE